MKIGQIKPNPNNPRVIKDESFYKLVKSIKEFPKMMTLRPLIIDSNNMIIAGNQRLKALKDLDYKEIPDDWIKKAEDFTENELNEFKLKDNVHAGEWDIDMLLKENDLDYLESIGIDLSDLGELDKLESINEMDEWEGMPDFEAKDNSLKIIIHFEDEETRDQYAKDNKLEFIKKESKAWSTWFPFKERDDLTSLKYD
jgi:hypothetical protein